MRPISLTFATLVLLSGLFGLPRAFGQTQMNCQLSSNLAGRGESVTLFAMLKNAADVQDYQTRINITRTSGTGTLSVNCHGSVAINELRNDYLFHGRPDTSPGTVCASQSAFSSVNSGGASAGPDSAYLAEYTLTVSADAASNSTFEVSIQPAPISALVDSSGDDIPFAAGTPCVLTISPPTLSLVAKPCTTCSPDLGLVEVALTVKSLDVPINGVQALFQFDPAILQLTSVTPGDGQGSPWDAAIVAGVVGSAGAMAASFVLNGGQTTADATIAILHFSTLGSGGTSVSFRPDSPPLSTKLTRASNNATILPVKINNGSVIVECFMGENCACQ